MLTRCKLYNIFGVNRCFLSTKNIKPLKPEADEDDGKSKQKPSQGAKLGERAFSAKERVVDWKIQQNKKGLSKLEPLLPTGTAKEEPDMVTESHFERSSIWKKRNRLPPSDVITLVAEEQIAEAMQRGFFDNVRGKGKPFTPDDLSPPGKGDLTERLINRMVSNQGFLPEWVETEKEIAMDIRNLRKFLFEKFRVTLKYCDVENISFTGDVKTNLDSWIKDINNQIDRLNLIVPMLRFQRVHVTLQRELKRLKASLSGQ